jgi:hypothetical protein
VNYPPRPADTAIPEKSNALRKVTTGAGNFLSGAFACSSRTTRGEVRRKRLLVGKSLVK